jgi:cephalosporin hydroxylase
MGELQNIGLKYGTDKSGVHSFNGRTFLDVYEKHFKDLKNNNINMLELGVLNGGSLKTWEEYFTNGNIVGLDIDPSRKSLESGRVSIFIGSQNDTEILSKIIEKFGVFDIIIDDASHINSLTIDSFEILFKNLKPGGMYVIEDTHCTYGSQFWPQFTHHSKNWPGMSYNKNIEFSNDRKIFNDFILNKIEYMDKLQGDIYSIHIYAETIIIEKNR